MALKDGNWFIWYNLKLPWKKASPGYHTFLWVCASSLPRDFSEASELTVYQRTLLNVGRASGILSLYLLANISDKPKILFGAPDEHSAKPGSGFVMLYTRSGTECSDLAANFILDLKGFVKYGYRYEFVSALLAYIIFCVNSSMYEFMCLESFHRRQLLDGKLFKAQYRLSVANLWLAFQRSSEQLSFNEQFVALT